MGYGDQNLANQPLQDVDSSCDCNKFCSEEDDCAYWVYVASSRECWLKRNFKEVVEDKKCISGRKEGIKLSSF